MGNMVTLTNVHCAGNPTFFPHQDPAKHRTLITVISNAKTRNGQDIRDEFTLVFWGKYAQMAALYLKKGRAINVTGRLKSYSIDTGRVKPNGKREIYRLTTIHVDRFEFGRDTMKELVERITANLQKAKQEGLIPANVTITAEYLLAVEPKPFVDYNPAVVAQTGLYGNAKVFIKGQGFLGPQNVPNATPAATTAAGVSVEQLQAQIQSLMAQLNQATQAAPTAPATPAAAPVAEGQAVDPFAS